MKPGKLRHIKSRAVHATMALASLPSGTGLSRHLACVRFRLARLARPWLRWIRGSVPRRGWDGPSACRRPPGAGVPCAWRAAFRGCAAHGVGAFHHAVPRFVHDPALPKMSMRHPRKRRDLCALLRMASAGQPPRHAICAAMVVTFLRFWEKPLHFDTRGPRFRQVCRQFIKFAKTMQPFTWR